jgi:hypothetical protein
MCIPIKGAPRGISDAQVADGIEPGKFAEAVEARGWQRAQWPALDRPSCSRRFIPEWFSGQP